MKKLNLCMAAMAVCLGLGCLGGCAKDEMAYQGETSKLKITTRAEEDDTPLKDALLYIFNTEGTCTKIIPADKLDGTKAISEKPGTYKLIAIGGDDLSNYNLPTQDNATENSTITLNEGKKLNDLLIGTSNTDLEEASTTKMTMTLNRAVTCIKHVTIEELPTDITETEMSIGPVYTQVKLNGEYTDETKNISLSLTKNNTTGDWEYTGDSIVSLPSKGNPTIKITLTTPEVIKEYTYQTNKPLRKNYYSQFRLNYNKGVISYMTAKMNAQEWEGTDSNGFTLTEDNLTKVDSIKKGERKDSTPKQGGSYDKYLVVSVDSAARTAVLLRRQGTTDVWNDSTLNVRAYSIARPQGALIDHWRLPTQSEMTWVLENAELIGKNDTDDLNYKITEGSYYYVDEKNAIGRIHLDIPKSGKNKGVRKIKAYPDAGYSDIFIYRPVIDVKY